MNLHFECETIYYMIHVYHYRVIVKQDTIIITDKNLFLLSYYYLLSLLEKCLLFNVTNRYFVQVEYRVFPPNCSFMLVFIQ